MINPTKEMYLSSNQNCDRLFKVSSIESDVVNDEVPAEALLGDEAYINAIRMRPINNEGEVNEK